MTTSFSLVSDPWIPVVYTCGRSGELSLQELFAWADEVRDLAVNPYERVAVMRLLTCVTHAALGGPANRKEWRKCRADISLATASYLERWHGAFSLFGSAPFLQVSDLKLATDDEGVSVSTLDCALASGANPTLFDHAGGERRSLNPLSLLAHQSFSTGGLIGVGYWGGQPTNGWTTYPRPSVGRSSHAPCLAGNMLHAILIGATLLETLHLNLLNQELVAEALGDDRWGKPVWEQMPTSPLDKPAVENASSTYLGRLVPLSRAILLRDDRQTLARANGLDYPDYSEGFREPSATIIAIKKDGKDMRATLRAQFERATWRELHSLTVRRIDQKGMSGPLALSNLDDGQEFDLWTGALLADKAKVLGSLESIFSQIPATMLDETGQRIYQDGIQYAEGFAARLREAVTAYHVALGDKIDRPEAKDRRSQWQRAALAAFWTGAEQSRPLLLELVRTAGDESDYAETAWGKAIQRAAHRAYENTCPHDTSRQMKAFVAGLNKLSINQPNNQTKQTKQS
jgi:CRISPR system Cascade subunit CasA